MTNGRCRRTATSEWTSNKRWRESHESLILINMKGSSRRAWKFVRLVAKEHRKSKKDLSALKAYCTLCKSYITYSKGNRNSVYRYLEKCHQIEMDQTANTTHDAKPSIKQKSSKHRFSNIVKEQNLRVASREDRLLGDAFFVKWTSECLRPFKTQTSA